MQETDRLCVVFAHNDEAIPPEFYPECPPSNKHFSARQLAKWKSRRMASFLLAQIAQHYALDPTLFTHILRTQSGRPYLASEQIDFNISHSGDWVAVIFAMAKTKKAVGIDIEHPQKVRRYADLLTYYASEREISEIQNSTLLPQLPELTQRFYLSWCLREAVLKSQGVGIVKLSEVQHSLANQTIYSAHCPSGQLHFYHQLPFYLAYFVEQADFPIPKLTQWQGGQWQEIAIQPSVSYQVN